MKKLLLLSMMFLLNQVVYSADYTSFVTASPCAIAPNGPNVLTLMSKDGIAARDLSVTAAQSVPFLKKRISLSQNISITLTLKNIENEKELSCLYEYIMQRYNENKNQKEEAESKEKKLPSFVSSAMDTNPSIVWNKYCLANSIDVNTIHHVIESASMLFEEDAPLWLFESWHDTIKTLIARTADHRCVEFSQEGDKKTILLGNDMILMRKNGSLYQTFFDHTSLTFGPLAEIADANFKALSSLGMCKSISLNDKGNELCVGYNFQASDTFAIFNIDENGILRIEAQHAAAVQSAISNCQSQLSQQQNNQPSLQPKKSKDSDDNRGSASWNDLWTKHVLAKCIALTAFVNGDMRKFFVHCASRIAMDVSREYIKTRANEMWQQCYNSKWFPSWTKVSGFCDEHPFIALSVMFGFIAYFNRKHELMPGIPPRR